MGYYRTDLGVFPLLLTIVIIVAMQGILLISGARADTSCHCETRLDNGTIDWTAGSVRAVGKASPPASSTSASPDAVVGAAKADASRNLISVLKTLVPTIETSGENGSASRETLLAGIEKTAMDAQIVDQHYTSDRAMEVVLEISMFGGFLQLVLPEEIAEIPTIEAIATGKTGDELSRTGIPYTGLILDARGIDFSPVIYPNIVSELGDPIYASMFISREYAVHQGVCQYVCCMEQAHEETRAGINPMVIKGLRKGGNMNTAIVISRSDAEKIEKATEFHSFMRQCKVIIVLGQ